MAIETGTENNIDAHRILEEAQALMELEAVARRINPEKPDFRELDEFLQRIVVDSSPSYARSLLLRVGERLKNRIESIHRLDYNDPEIFSLIFGVTPPSKLRLKRDAYSLQFDLEDGDYKAITMSIGLGKGYANTQGVCLHQTHIKPRMRKAVGGSVILAKTVRKPRLDQDAEKLMERIALMDTEGNFYARGMDRLERLRIDWDRCDDLVLDRHEQMHAFQNIAVRAGYPVLNGALEQSLLEEEQAQHIAELDTGTKTGRRPLLHTAYYSEFGLPEGRFAEMARAYHKTNGLAGAHQRKATTAVITQRSRNGEALARFRTVADVRLNYLADWVLPTIDFYITDKVIKKLAAVYPTT